MQLRRAFCLICCATLFTAQSVGEETPAKQPHNVKTVNQAFTPGEKLAYSVSWSNIFTAAVATMEVQDSVTADGKSAYRFVTTGKTVGLVDALYSVEGSIESLVDRETLRSLSFSLKERHKKKLRRKELTFDYQNKTVRSALNDDKPEMFPIPEHVLDVPSTLYYARTRQDFIVGKPLVLNVFESGKTWQVEVHTLGKEKIETVLGEIDAIKVKTHPKYEGVFMITGETLIWLTDDAKKIPVLMKSKVAIGAIIATLTDIQGIQGIKIDHAIKEDKDNTDRAQTFE